MRGMPSPRPDLHATVPAAALLWVAALAGCAETPPEAVAPIVLTEPTGTPVPTTTDVGAEPVQPPGPAPAGEDTDDREDTPAPVDDDRPDDRADDAERPDDGDDGDDEGDDD